MAGSNEKFPAPVYSRTVLAVNFADAQRHYREALFAIHEAHGVMLAEQGLLGRDEARSIFSALKKIDQQALAAAQYDGSVEDFFFYVERELTKLCPPEIAGKLHTARSRNDLAITHYRMSLRQELLGLHERIATAIGAILNLADEHRETVMPAHTHTQPAQPTTLAHYLMAIGECFLRDLIRIEHAYATVNRSPMGSCGTRCTTALSRRSGRRSASDSSFCYGVTAGCPALESERRCAERDQYLCG